jgi:hypothetical protein
MELRVLTEILEGRVVVLVVESAVATPELSAKPASR